MDHWQPFMSTNDDCRLVEFLAETTCKDGPTYYVVKTYKEDVPAPRIVCTPNAAATKLLVERITGIADVALPIPHDPHRKEDTPRCPKPK